MLRYLRIRNLAIIESVSVEFDAGLNVLTGETGAGKSILVEAVALLLGGRASSELVRTGEDLAEVEALFEHGSHETLVRREITGQGRSRAFVNGALATAATLRELSERLIELHGQHEHQVLADPESHLELLDAFGAHHALRDRVAAAFSRMDALRRERDRLQLDERQKLARIDLLTFQRDEIARANPQPGEDEQLAGQRQVLANAERLLRASADAYAALYDSDHAALSALNTVWKRVGELAAVDARLTPYVEARDAIKSQLEDLAYFLRSYGDEIDASPQRLQEVEDRLALLDRLKKKFGPTLSDVIGHLETATTELAALEQSEQRLASIEREVAEARAAYIASARELSTARRASADRLSKRLVTRLADLAMRHARFSVAFTEVAEPGWSARGIDVAEFLVSLNPGEDVRPLARIASGGELSRIMLAIRSASRPPDPDRTLVFDEVDAGIGGRAADDVGRVLGEMGGATQVLCITHLPQIAASGTSHFQVAKTVVDGRTITSVRRLIGSEREAEIARMMAGSTVSAGVLASAAELLRSRSGSAAPLSPSGRHVLKSAENTSAKGESESQKRKAKGRA